jgi:hypothetical protein
MPFVQDECLHGLVSKSDLMLAKVLKVNTSNEWLYEAQNPLMIDQ